MRRLGQTTAQLRSYKKQWEELAAGHGGAHGAAAGSGRLAPLSDFGSNPGRLQGFSFVPASLAEGAPLVVVLHGCQQSASGYDNGTGWSTLAERHGFAVLFPEQQAENNPNACFNWFVPGDIARGRGEPLSIRQMIDTMVSRHGLNPRRVFITGLSAGGAMTAVMLATYPDIFAGGAIIAGLPYGCAHNVQDAFDCMFQGREASPREWGDRVRAASPHRGPWPKLSVWHGSADATVRSMNAGEIIKQWTDVHGLPLMPTARDIVDGYPRETWSRDGETVIESFTIAGMAHGTPLAAGDGIGKAGPFLLDVGISSTERIAEFWGIIPKDDTGRARPVSPPKGAEVPPPALEAERPGSAHRDIGSIINGALRSAGLIKD